MFLPSTPKQSCTRDNPAPNSKWSCHLLFLIFDSPPLRFSSKLHRDQQTCPLRKPCKYCADVAGKPVAYKLMATPNPIILADPNSTIGRRAIFATKNLWVTPHSESERFPAGDYTLGSKGNVGLSEWTKQVDPQSLALLCFDCSFLAVSLEEHSFLCCIIMHVVSQRILLSAPERWGNVVCSCNLQERVCNGDCRKLLVCLP